MSGALGSSTKYPDVARPSQLETGDEILKGKGDLATLRQVTMGNGSSTWA